LAIIEAFPTDEANRIYVLADSWYTSRDLLNACNARGFHVIAAVKSNRTICPAGIRTSMSDFAATYIDNEDLRSVNVENKRYRVYAYEGLLRIPKMFGCYYFGKASLTLTYVRFVSSVPI
jgi:hypothetical protein